MHDYSFLVISLRQYILVLFKGSYILGTNFNSTVLKDMDILQLVHHIHSLSCTPFLLPHPVLVILSHLYHKVTSKLSSFSDGIVSLDCLIRQPLKHLLSCSVAIHQLLQHILLLLPLLQQLFCQDDDNTSYSLHLDVALFIVRLE